MELTIMRCIMATLDYFSAFILSLILLSCLLEKNKTPLLKIYTGMASACAFSLLLEAVSISASFFNFRGIDGLKMVLNDLAIIGGYGLSMCYTYYVANLVGFHRTFCSWVLRFLRFAGFVAVCILIGGNLVGLFFTIENKILSPGKFFVCTFAFDILACLAGILLIIVYAKQLQTKDVIALLTLPGFIFLSAAVQYLSFQMMYGLFLMAGVSVFIIYLMIQTDRNLRTVAQEKQMMDLNISMMLSQIQPHFLYNALSSIRRMIRKDPQVAETAVENFAMYLRKNLESMNRVEPIPFTTELAHLKQYLYLEKLRFGDRLRVEYEITFSDFALPVLSLQPIVENAVKHGILKKEEGGSIWIKTRREDGNVVLTVEDDGVGFVPGTIQSQDRIHIGYENVKRRIELQCGGSVSVESQQGAGTTVTMTIPLE